MGTNHRPLTLPSLLAGERGSKVLLQNMLTTTRIKSDVILQKKLHYMAKHLRQNMTQSEKVLWIYLRDKRYFQARFRRQYPIDQYIVDFCCVKKRLIVEVDGLIHEGQKIHDQERDKKIGLYGYSVIRFSNDEVMKYTSSVIEKIQNILKCSSVSCKEREVGR